MWAQRSGGDAVRWRGLAELVCLCRQGSGQRTRAVHVLARGFVLLCQGVSRARSMWSERVTAAHIYHCAGAAAGGRVCLVSYFLLARHGRVVRGPSYLTRPGLEPGISGSGGRRLVH